MGRGVGEEKDGDERVDVVVPVDSDDDNVGFCSDLNSVNSHHHAMVKSIIFNNTTITNSSRILVEKIKERKENACRKVLIEKNA